MSNAKYLAFGTLNIKKPLTLDVLNAKRFGINKQYRSKFGMVQILMLRALASKDAKKLYFTSSKSTLSILPSHFTIHLTSQYLFLDITY